MKIYIAAPYTKGDTGMNVRSAIFAQDYIESELGHMAYNPLLSHFQHLIIPHEDISYWYAKDIRWLRECDAILRLPGESTGADAEVAIARGIGLQIFTALLDIPKARGRDAGRGWDK